jgi:hypothetical protein
MAVDIEVKCIKKSHRDDPHERIHGIGGVNANGTRWYLAEGDAIAGIDQGKWRFRTIGGRRSV